MNRKAVLATMVTILFILPLVLLVYAGSANVKTTQSAYADTETGIKAHFADEDIVQDILDLAGYSSLANATSATFRLTGIGTLGAPSPLANYSSFITTYYNQQVNVVASLEGSIFPITVTPGYVLTAGSSFAMAPQPATTPYDDLDSIFLTITLDRYAANLTANGTPANNGPVAFDVLLLDPSGGTILDYPYAALDPLYANAPFTASFDDGASIAIAFGDTAGSPGTLTVIPSALTAAIDDLTATFNATDALHATTNTTIDILVPGSIRKQGMAHD